jgi:phosphatidylserine/phosphatidylglycerophosphate/cardiolipin synthase-like enzyme
LPAFAALALVAILADALPGGSAPAAPPRTARPSIQLVETVPVEFRIGNPDLPAAHDVWIEMIRGARRTLDCEEFYLSTWPGEPMDDIVREIGKAAARGVQVRLLLDARMHDTYPQPADSLGGVPNIAVRTIDVRRVMGSGVQHSKFFLVDGAETYLGSQNFDWRALKHIHELGVRIRDPRVTADFQRVFERDWNAADTTGAPSAQAPPAQDAPALPFAVVQSPGDTVHVWTSYSPRGFIPDSTRWDRDAIVRLLDGARSEITVQLLSYGLGEGERRDESLDSALRRAAGRGVRVRLLISDWMAGRPAMAALESLAAVAHIEVRLSVVPEWSRAYIPFARVDHCKYVTVDTLTTWVGTSNWEPSYFHGSRNIAVTLKNRRLALQARRVFGTSWAAPGTIAVRAGATYAPRVHGTEGPPGRAVHGQ